VICGSRRLTAKAPIEALTTGEKAMTNNTNDDFEDLYKDLPADEREYMERYHKPDGVCFHCGQPANQHHPVGPITITVMAFSREWDRAVDGSPNRLDAAV